jgi:hypothetical protein
MLISDDEIFVPGDVDEVLLDYFDQNRLGGVLAKENLSVLRFGHFAQGVQLGLVNVRRK